MGQSEGLVRDITQRDYARNTPLSTTFHPTNATFTYHQPRNFYPTFPSSPSVTRRLSRVASRQHSLRVRSVGCASTAIYLIVLTTTPTQRCIYHCHPRNFNPTFPFSRGPVPHPSQVANLRTNPQARRLANHRHNPRVRFVCFSLLFLFDCFE